MPKSNYSPPNGPGKGPASGKPAKPFTAEDGVKSLGYVRQARAAARERAEAEGRAKNYERPPSRLEIAEIAKPRMPAAVDEIVRVIHESRSDMAKVQAFQALKEVAYGKDAQAIDIKFEYESLSDAELQAEITAELERLTIEHDPTGGGTAGGGATA